MDHSPSFRPGSGGAARAHEAGPGDGGQGRDVAEHAFAHQGVDDPDRDAAEKGGVSQVMLSERMRQGSPLVMARTAPLTDSRMPAIFHRVRGSRNTMAAARAVKMGFAGHDDRGPACGHGFQPFEEQDIVGEYAGEPQDEDGQDLWRPQAGRPRSLHRVRARRQAEARAKRRKAAEKGPTSWETILPATKVPPQNRAMSSSLA